MMYEFKTRLGSHLYNRLPRLYRFADSETDYTLARFLDALGGSLDYTYNSVEEILKLLDVEKMDVRFLPFYARMFGVTYENDVPEEFQRKFLANLVDIFKRKGTKEVIEFIAREITGMEADVREAHHFTFRTWGTNPHDEMVGGFTTPKTYDSSQDFIYYLGGDSKTSRYTVYITLYTEQALEDVDIREELIRRYCEGLKPHYTTLVFRVRGVSIEDEFIYPVLEEEYKDLYNFGDVKQSNIGYTLVEKIHMQEDLETYTGNITEHYSHSLVQDSIDSEYIAVSILEVDLSTPTETPITTKEGENLVTQDSLVILYK